MRTELLNNRKRRPTHPGELLREEVLPHLEVSQVALAEMLNVSRQTKWIRMQEAVDVWDTFQANRKEYDKIQPINR